MVRHSINIVRWDTPVSDLDSVVLVSLVDDGELAIVVDGAQGSKRERFRFLFKNVFGYRNLLEEYRTALWQTVQGTPHVGWTGRIVNSPWLDELRRKEPLFLIHGGEHAVHYLLCTEDDVIDVLTEVAPEIGREKI
jgi:hypothetical protein